MKKVMLFTGSTGRLGTAFATKYYKDYTIVGVARQKPRHIVTHDFVQGDITKEANKIVRQVLKKHGRIDVLVNAAVEYMMKSGEYLSGSDLAYAFKTNVIAPQNLANIILHKFWKNNVAQNKSVGRSVINIGSWSAKHVYPGQAAYSGTKAALQMMTHHMADEFDKYNIRVGLLSPTTLTASSQALITAADALFELEGSTAKGRKPKNKGKAALINI